MWSRGQNYCYFSIPNTTSLYLDFTVQKVLNVKIKKLYHNYIKGCTEVKFEDLLSCVRLYILVLMPSNNLIQRDAQVASNMVTLISSHYKSKKDPETASQSGNPPFVNRYIYSGFYLFLIQILSHLINNCHNYRNCTPY